MGILFGLANQLALAAIAIGLLTLSSSGFAIAAVTRRSTDATEADNGGEGPSVGSVPQK